MINRIALSLLLAVIGVGCSKPSPIVGDWNSGSNGTAVVVTFTADNKVTGVIKSGPTMPVAVTLSGTYELKDNVLNVTMNDFKLQATDPTKQAALDAQLGKVKSQELAQINASGKNNKLTWQSNDQFTTTDAKGTSQVYTRVKK